MFSCEYCEMFKSNFFHITPPLAAFVIQAMTSSLTFYFEFLDILDQIRSVTIIDCQHSEATARGVFWKKMFLKFLQNSQESTCVRASFLIRKRLQHRCFPVNFAKFLRASFYRTPPDDCWTFVLRKFKNYG